MRFSLPRTASQEGEEQPDISVRLADGSVHIVGPITSSPSSTSSLLILALERPLSDGLLSSTPPFSLLSPICILPPMMDEQVGPLLGDLPGETACREVRIFFSTDLLLLLYLLLPLLLQYTTLLLL